MRRHKAWRGGSTAQQSCEPATAPVVWRLVTWQAVALPSRRQTSLIFHSFFNLFVVWSFRKVRITSKELHKQGECQMCNDFLRQCYWNRQRPVSRRACLCARGPQNSFLGAKSRFSVVPDTRKRSQTLLEFKILKFSLNL